MLRFALPAGLTAGLLLTLGAVASPANSVSPSPSDSALTAVEQVGADGCPTPSSVKGAETLQQINVYGRVLRLAGQRPTPTSSYCVFGELSGVAIHKGDRMWLTRNGVDMSNKGGAVNVAAGQTKVWTPQGFRDGSSDSAFVCFYAWDRPKDPKCTLSWLPAPEDPASVSPSGPSKPPVTESSSQPAPTPSSPPPSLDSDSTKPPSPAES